MQIRDMKSNDLAKVLEIEQTLFPTDAWTKALFLEELAQVPISRAVVVAEIDQLIIGYASLRFVGKEGDINTIAISPSHQRCGYGNQLLTWMLRTAKVKGVRDLFLDVRADNVAAIEMYKNAGFERIDIRRNYYDHAVDAHVMRKKIS
jgi:ribosomal-protein-alanine N-acetyltransferase